MTNPNPSIFNSISLSIWDALTSIYAVIIYAAIIFAALLALVFLLIKKEISSSKSIDQNQVDTTQRKRFFMLSKIDDEKDTAPQSEFDDLSFFELCQRFQNFSASKLKLYYDIEDIRKFFAGLAVSKLIILQGISGTGKTSLAYAFGEFISNPTTVIPVQPMWKERTDLLGYYNEFTKKFNETALLQKIYQANYSDEMFVTLLDEMNIARIEYYFAEFLSLLELPNPETRLIDVVSDEWATDPLQLQNGKIRLSPNMWFLGTANNDDTTFAISDKVYDRAMVINLDSHAQAFDAPDTQAIKLSFSHFNELTKQALEEYQLTKRNEERLNQLDKYMIENFALTFGNRIKKQIESYIPIFISCGGSELDALDDILSKKLIRKLEFQNSVHLKNSAQALCDTLDQIFGEDNMPQCKQCVQKILRNL